MDVHFKLEDIQQTASAFLEALGNIKVVAMHGDMGAGKTTFVHAVCDVLCVKETVSSPTFSIINQYSYGDNKTIFHIDLYRLKNEQEAISAGVEECLYSGNLCLVEWPEITPGIFPDDTVHLYLSLQADNERLLKLKL